jgi:hypothetical protein
VLHEATNQAVISEHEDATLHVRVGSELFAAFVARRCTREGAVVMAQPDGGAVDAPVTMFHGHEAITTPTAQRRCRPPRRGRRRVTNQNVTMIPATITRAGRSFTMP